MTTIGVISILSKNTNATYSFFLEKLNQKEVDLATYDKESADFKITLKNGETYTIPNPQTDEFKEYLLLNEVKVNQQVLIDWEIIIYIITFIAIIVFFFVPWYISFYVNYFI